MSTMPYIKNLSNKCEKLNREIRDSHLHHGYDERLSLLKKKRLRVKQEIEIMTRKLELENVVSA